MYYGNGNAEAGGSAVWSPNTRPLLMSFTDIKEKFPEILVCGPREVNEIFGTHFPEDLLALNYNQTLGFIERVQEDFGEKDPAIGIFLTVPRNLEEMMKEFGENFYSGAEWVNGPRHRFSGIPIECSVILTALESNPVFRGRTRAVQENLAKSRKWNIISVTESVFTLLMAKILTGVRHKSSHKDRTSTACFMPKREIVDGDVVTGSRKNYVCVGEFSTVSGMKITAYPDTALMDMGAAVGVVRRIDL